MHYHDYIKALHESILQVDESTIQSFVHSLKYVKERGGRVFFIGVGGSAANCSHAVNDFRKIAGMDALTPVDNVSELTAYTNDVSFSDCFTESLKTSQLNNKDAICIFSVGGGGENVSKNIVKVIDFAKSRKALVLGIVSRDGGYTLAKADVCIHFCPNNKELVTPIAESLQVVFFHYIVNKIKEAH